MKSVVNAPICEKKARPFPKLMIGDNGVLYFVRKAGGMYFYLVVNNGGLLHHKVGDASEARELSHYLSDFEGTVTLSND